MKNSLLVSACKAPILLYAILASTLVAAQGAGSVVESQAYTPGQGQSLFFPQSQSQAPAQAQSQPQFQSQSPPPASSSNSDALSLLLDQNQQLQSEVQALRGLVEEQSFELRKLQQDSLNRYTSTDDRLSSLETGGVSSSSNSVTSIPDTGAISPDPSALTRAPIQPIDTRLPIDNPIVDVPVIETRQQALGPRNPSRSSGRGTLQPAVLSEQQLYQMAYDSVINSNFDRSIAEFDQYLSIYPEGRFIDNAHYWKGQAYLYLNRYTEARESYDIIVNQDEDSIKLPDAMYGLALAYQGLGNIRRARQLLTDIKRRFPNTGVANLADTRLLSLD